MARYSLISRGVLVAGAGGFVGKAFTARIFRGQKPKRLSGNLSDSTYCRKIFKGVHTAYYLAGAKANLRFHTAEPFIFVDGNVRPFLTFLSSASRSRVRKIIYLSSTIVEYADIDAELDGYVLGKTINEQIFLAFSKQFPKIATKLVRAAPVYGPGDSFKPATANFIPATIMKVYNSQREIEVWGSGKRKLQFIYIDDLVANLLEAAKAKGDFFSIGNPESKSVNEIVQIVIRLSGKKLGIRNNAHGADKPTKLVQFRNLIRPRMSLKEGLSRTIKYYRA